MRPKLDNDVPRFVEQSHGQFAGWLGEVHQSAHIDADPSRADYRVADFRPPRRYLRGATRRAAGTLLDDVEERLRREGDNPTREVMERHYRRAFDLLDASVGGGAFSTRERTGRTS